MRPRTLFPCLVALGLHTLACNGTGFSGGGKKSAATSPTTPKPGSSNAGVAAKTPNSDTPVIVSDPGAGSIGALVTNALNKEPVVGAVVRIVPSGPSCTTDATGQCQIANVSASQLSLEASASGFITQPYQRSASETTVRFVLSPELSSGQTRLVLTWGSDPDDLDSHLLSTRNDGVNDHVWFANQEGDGAVLDVDSTDGYGPETVTITKLAPGRYRYLVHDFTHSDEAPTSGGIADATAVVRLYIKGQTPREFRPAKGKIGVVWNVLSFTINSAGAISVTEDGSFSNDSDKVLEDEGGGGI